MRCATWASAVVAAAPTAPTIVAAIAQRSDAQSMPTRLSSEIDPGPIAVIAKTIAAITSGYSKPAGGRPDAVLPMHGRDCRHHDRHHQQARDRDEEAEPEQGSAGEFAGPSQECERDPGDEPDALEERAGSGQTMALEPAKELLAAVSRQKPPTITRSTSSPTDISTHLLRCGQQE